MEKKIVEDSATTPIDIAPEKFRRLGYELIDQISEFLGDIQNRPVTADISPEELRRIIHSRDSLPLDAADPEELLRNITAQLISYSLFNGHPRFWGYITSSAAPIGMLGDLLAAAVNPNVGAWQLAPVATEIEAQTVRWIAELLNYPSDCGGLLVSGGNMANFVGFLAARAAMAAGNIRAEGMLATSAKPLRVYASVETHTWIHKATDLFGLGTDSIRWVKTDSKQRLLLDDLRRLIEYDRTNGDIPMLAVGSAGTVSTGAIDPLPEMAELCQEYGIWFHVDGAYGAFAAILDDIDPALRGLSRADSVAVDPHKWLYAPLEAGCALVRHSQKLREAFSYHPPYYHFGEEALNYFDYGLQNSRGFRALKVWLALKQVGRRGYASMLRENIRLSQKMFRLLEREPLIETFTQNLSISTFRYLPADLKDRKNEKKIAEYLNKLNEEILVRLKKSGEIFVSNAVINQSFLLRACIVNFRTRAEDIEIVPEIVIRHGKSADSELRESLLN
ncbi:MAG: aspartate aminotransferase family protein [bacterium]|jgi:glutamate/tyrosine decarboxylase-like PLP-dependent enzyme